MGRNNVAKRGRKPAVVPVTMTTTIVSYEDQEAERRWRQSLATMLRWLDELEQEERNASAALEGNSTTRVTDPALPAVGGARGSQVRGLIMF